jgi:adenine-specific DNA methylase
MYYAKMKYMGSKRAMLKNGLGELLEHEIRSACRFVDLFAGSGSVAIHVAQQFPIPVAAVDLQQYSAVVTSAVVGRQRRLGWWKIWEKWEAQATRTFESSGAPNSVDLTQAAVRNLRSWCSRQKSLPITKAYGGHYFSPQQAVWIDALRANLPTKNSPRIAALAALIQAASQCAAAPGHTAQPFQPTPTALPFLGEAWTRDIVTRTRQALSELAGICALQRGSANVADANGFARRLRESDLVFIDPPYSGVHYSRFYHVLETIAQGECGVVSGVGRYPDTKLRPRSRYSLKTESAVALDELLQIISSRGAKAILTFPNHDCSNGLSGEQVRKIARRHFSVKEQMVTSRFSTLGGNNGDGNKPHGRAPRRDAQELVLVLRP